ncbi:hypothetical protein, partial [Acidianus sp. RZ1]
DSISKYQIKSSNDWNVISGKDGTYIVKEFDTYGVLVYPPNPQTDVALSFNEKISWIDKFREILYKPIYWREYITVIISDSMIYTTPDLNLERFNGIDLVNDVLRSQNIEFIEIDDSIRIGVKIKRPLSRQSLEEGIKSLTRALGLYYKIKEAQEDIAVKLASRFY